MAFGWRGWAGALLGSIAIHAALTIGVRLPQPGSPIKSAGSPVSVSGTLAGILGAQNAPTAEAVEAPAEIRLADVAKPAPPAAVEPVVTRPVPPLSAQDRLPEVARAHTPPPTHSTDIAPLILPVAPPVAVASVPARSADLAPPRAAEPAKLEPLHDLQRATSKRRQVTPTPALRKKRPQKRKKPVREKRRSAAPAKPGSNQRGAAGSKRGGQGGRSHANAGAMRSYARRVRSRILANRPSGAGSGRVVIVFGLSPRGRLRFVRISRRSGNAGLDRAALAAVRRSVPFPRPPRGASVRQLRFTIPFRFN